MSNEMSEEIILVDDYYRLQLKRILNIHDAELNALIRRINTEIFRLRRTYERLPFRYPGDTVYPELFCRLLLKGFASNLAFVECAKIIQAEVELQKHFKAASINYTPIFSPDSISRFFNKQFL